MAKENSEVQRILNNRFSLDAKFDNLNLKKIKFSVYKPVGFEEKAGVSGALYENIKTREKTFIPLPGLPKAVMEGKLGLFEWMRGNYEKSMIFS
jgi:hypothetical protein